jgi:hypothetical protein
MSERDRGDPRRARPHAITQAAVFHHEFVAIRESVIGTNSPSDAAAGFVWFRGREAHVRYSVHGHETHAAGKPNSSGDG